MREKPAVAVSQQMIEGKPRILIAFYLDSPGITVTKDDDGRPVALAAFEPEAAYKALATRIIAAYDALQGEQEEQQEE